MSHLNFPDYKFNIRVNGSSREIFDRVRRKFVALQPEELVRQNMVEFLIREKLFPPELIANEASVTINGMQKRCDTVVYNRKSTPVMIVEYKAPTVAISQSVFDQILTYNTVLHVPYLLVSNGLQHICCHIDGTQATFLREIPPYSVVSSL